jgi:hypothetical protein
MAITFKEWLKLKFDRVFSVQTTVLNSEYADLAVLCWSGSKIHIYMIDQPTSPRAIRRALNENKGMGVNTMFLVDVRILPPDDSRVRPKDWMTALHALNNDRIYAYQVTENGPEIIQVHLEDVQGSDENKVWYGPKIDFSRLRYFRRTYKLRSIKGDWRIADFSSPAFWKNHDYRAARAQHERTRTGQTRWQEWSAYQTWSGKTDEDQQQQARQNGKDERTRSHAAIGDYLTQCYRLLGVERDASAEVIKKAFRKRALIYHPDTSELPEEEAAMKFKALNAAYDYIKSANGW